MATDGFWADFVEGLLVGVGDNFEIDVGDSRNVLSGNVNGIDDVYAGFDFE